MEYNIERKKIKNYIIKIYPDLKISVSVPLYTTNMEIEKFINSKREWIEKNVEKIKERKKNIISENQIIFLEKVLKVEIINSELVRIKYTEKNLFVYTFEEDKSKIKIFIEKWKAEQLKIILEEYIVKFSKLLNVNVDHFFIKKMKSAWGIYHKKGNYISFNIDLIEKNKETIEYVVLHEMCHIFHMNHQKRFWSLVEKFMPDYKERRKKLKL